MAKLLKGREDYLKLPDPAARETDRAIKELSDRIAKEYRQAVKETQGKLDDYFRRFEIKDNTWREWVASGQKTEKEYKAWREGQMMVGQKWDDMKEELARDLHNRNLTAREYVKDSLPNAYAINFNYGTYDVETQARVNTGFTLYDEATVKRIMKEQPELLPPPGKKMSAKIKRNPDIAWQKGQLQSVTMQSILQGESIPNMAKRIARTMGERNHKDSVRYARTAMTGAQNAGREDAYKRAEGLGVEMVEMWIATHDDRTRHEHRLLDDQVKEVGGTFVVPGTGEEIRYPGDPLADDSMIWNCRCSTRAVVRGLSPTSRLEQTMVGDISYSEWKAGHGKSQDILMQEQKGEAIKESYLREYRGGAEGGERRKEQTPDQNIEGGRNQSLDQITEKTLNLAKENEPEVTRVLQEITKNTGGQMEGLDYRLKGYDSLKRKIHDKAVKKGISEYDYARSVTDALRFTVKASPYEFTSTYNAVVKGLESNGMKMAEVVNTLKSKSEPYRGINTLVRSKTGYIFELQFHTPQSLEIKEVNHKLYEEQRLLTTSKERKKELNMIMMRNARNIQSPKGIDSIKNLTFDRNG